jgi:hypothetical protein
MRIRRTNTGSIALPSDSEESDAGGNVATVSNRRVRRGGRGDAKQYIGVLYSALALAVAVALLPSILRPPPEQTSDSAALNPGAPPDDQADSLIEARQQAQGSGAGASGQAAGPTTTLPKPKAFGQCYGSPARVIESVYAAPCAPAWKGDNGGATAKNVFPNEVRLSLWHGLAAPTAGRINPEAHAGENAVDRTLRVLEVYMNAHYQTWGRHVSFYGGAENGSTPEEQQAEANHELNDWKIFGAWHIDKPFCERIASVGPVICNPFEHSYFLRHRPNFYSFMMDIDQSNAFDAEFACKKLVGKPPEWAGVDVDKTKPRKFGNVAESTVSVTQSPDAFNHAFTKECGQPRIPDSYTVDSNRPETISIAMQQMYQSHVTTILLNVLGGTAAIMMAAADALGWHPEWMIMGNYGLDLNNFGRIFPPTQSAHTFGINTWELPHAFEQWECEVAYKSVDPSNTADRDTCEYYWHPIVILMNMIQEAGPHLTPQAVADGVNRMGYNFPTDPPWAIGGGYGPDDFSYMDNVGVVWWSNSRVDPNTGDPGAYVWVDGGRRFRRGEIPADNSEMFHSGVTGPGQTDTSGG